MSEASRLRAIESRLRAHEERIEQLEQTVETLEEMLTRPELMPDPREAVDTEPQYPVLNSGHRIVNEDKSTGKRRRKLTLKTAAHYFGVAIEDLHRLVEEGVLPCTERVPYDPQSRHFSGTELSEVLNKDATKRPPPPLPPTTQRFDLRE